MCVCVHACMCVCGCVCVLYIGLCVCAFPVDLVKYMTTFQWDRAKYPISLPLRVLVDNINKVPRHHGPQPIRVL